VILDVSLLGRKPESNKRPLLTDVTEQRRYLEENGQLHAKITLTHGERPLISTGLATEHAAERQRLVEQLNIEHRLVLEQKNMQLKDRDWWSN
jgi:hypothetical protein